MIPTPSVSIGMSKAEVTKHWGNPAQVKRTQTRNGLTERWVYPGDKVLTFANGSLEVIED
jgi:hypothetical protein